MAVFTHWQDENVIKCKIEISQLFRERGGGTGGAGRQEKQQARARARGKHRLAAPQTNNL